MAHHRAWTLRGSRRSMTSGRSEEHTSELQSLAYLVCRLLREKKRYPRAPTLADSNSDRCAAGSSHDSDRAPPTAPPQSAPLLPRAGASGRIRGPVARAPPPGAAARPFFSCSGAHRDLHSFPTRRSSDLHAVGGAEAGRAVLVRRARITERAALGLTRAAACRRADLAGVAVVASDRATGDARLAAAAAGRSEEHTSELQSLAYLVCRLLLE